MKVGRGKRLGEMDSIFYYPLSHKLDEAFLNVYVANDYLNKKKTLVRNAFQIPQARSQAAPEEVRDEAKESRVYLAYLGCRLPEPINLILTLNILKFRVTSS
jgi:hypothetical protein